MSKKLTIALLSMACMLSTFAQGPNRTFGKFRKLKDAEELTATSNYATIMFAFEKGTYVNPIIKAAIGIDDKYAIALKTGDYIEVKLPAGKHKISLAQGVNDGSTMHKVAECECEIEGYRGLCSMFSNWGNYRIMLGKDITNLEYNLTKVPYTNKIFAYQINYLTYERNFEEGKTYYFKTIKLAKGLALSCGPLVTETTKDDFETIIKGKKIKGKSKAYFYKGK
jgi:hypothetical protein